MILKDLPFIIDEAISSIKSLKEVQEARYEMYKSRIFKRYEAEHCVIEMLRQGVINTQRVEKVIQQWDAPDHDEFTRTGNSAWRLVNAATESFKGLNLMELPQRTTKLHDLIDEVAGFEYAA